jgi:hypothetical protein
MTFSPNPIRRGQTATLSWTYYMFAASNGPLYASITGYGLVNPCPSWTSTYCYGSITVSPTSTTTYTMSGPYNYLGTYVSWFYPYACSATLVVNP